MTPDDRLTWDPEELHAIDLVCHFTVCRTEDSKVAILLDAFLPLAGALVGLSRPKTSSLFWKIGSSSKPPWVLEDFIRTALQQYRDVSGTDTSHVLGSVTHSNKEYRAFCQCLEEAGKYRIDIWLPASAACGYLSLMFSHQGLLLFAHHSGRVPVDLRNRLLKRVEHYLLVLKMVATASADGGTIVFEDFHIEPALPETLATGIEFFRFALTFIVFHEMAHIDLGHHTIRATRDAAQKRLQEFEADKLALSRMTKLRSSTPWSPFVGATIVLLAASLMSSIDDAVASPTHPALVERFEALCKLNDSLLPPETGPTREFVWPYLVNILGNLFDRDRCPSWLGKDRRAALGLAADHQFDNKKFDFKSTGYLNATEVGRASAQSRKINPI